MQAVDTGIQDNKKNVTRFLVLSRDPRVQVWFLLVYKGTHIC